MNLINRIALLCGAIVMGSNIATASPNIQQWNTDNGARVYFVESPELPMVDVRIIFDAAGAHDGDKPSMALMTNALLNEGTPSLNTEEIAERFDSLGAHFGATALRDMAVVSLRSLTQASLLDPAVTTLADILAHPSFPPASLERERKRLLIALQSKKQSPGALANEAFFQGIYPNHPYGQGPDGTEASVTALTRDDLVNFHKQYYVGSNATIAIVGAVDQDQAKVLAELIIGQLPTGKAAAKIPKVMPLEKAQLISKDFPSSQTHLLIGQPGMQRNDPDYFPLYVGNHILGGSGLVSRLSEEIREKRGLSYSTYSYFSPMRQHGPFQIGLQTRNDQAQEALDVVMETLIDFIDKGPTEKELTAAKQNITGGFALRLDSNKKIIEYVAMIGFYQLPMDYLDTLMSKVETVTAAQIQETFARRIQPDNLVTIMVGNHAETETE